MSRAERLPNISVFVSYLEIPLAAAFMLPLCIGMTFVALYSSSKS